MDNPDSVPYLIAASQINDKAKRLTTAYQFAERAVQLAPRLFASWLNLGRLNDELYRMDEAATCYERALEFAKGSKDRYLALMNMSGLAITRGDWKEAERTARLAISIDPTGRKANANLGMACLAQGKWVQGWAGYAHILGLDNRKLVQFANEGQWDGTKDQSIVIYGEQGLGDEICFASMFPDAIKDSRKVVIECDPKLRGLFARSFPQAKVYGTRWLKTAVWDEPDTKPDASISSGALGSLYRTKTEHFPGTPFLVPDPERVAMWKALWKTKDKPIIGLAWSGGVQWTGAKFRRIKLEQFLPLFRAVDALWISLQYQDAADEIAEFTAAHSEVDIRQYPATLTKDYDDTAAIVATIDLTIAPPTSVVNLAGGLGAPCIAMHGPYDCWKFAEGMSWHKTNMTLVPHVENWDKTIESIIPLVKERLNVS